MEKREYEFRCQIVDCETEEVVCAGAAFIGEISIDGESEGVDMEVGKVLRYFKKKGKENHERVHLGIEEE